MLRTHGITAEAMAEGRDEGSAAVDQPKVIQGSWVVAGLSAAQLLPALVGALIGIPAGTALYAAVQNGRSQASPPACGEVIGDQPRVVVIDEFPFRARASPSLPSIIQRELGPGGSGRGSMARLRACRQGRIRRRE
jgi:hypothetical protein